MLNRTMPVVSSLLAGLLLGALGGTAWADDAPATAASAAAADESQLEEVVVTGSLIKRPNAETAEAITSITAETLMDMGITSVEQALQQITAMQTTSFQTGSSVTTFTGGGSFANLRGLGASKTLVLVDGQRLADNVVIGNSVDVDGIPFAAIDHIEVLREGASALYGTDAIAGVVNFITKKNFDQGELNLEFTKPQKAGGGGAQADATWGIGNLKADGYNFMIAANYTDTRELRADQRPFATGFNPALGLDNNNGLGTVPGLYIDNDGNGNAWNVNYPSCPGNPHLETHTGYCGYLYSEAVDLIPWSTNFSGLMSVSKTLPGDNTLSLQYFYTRELSNPWGGPQEYAFQMNPSSPYFPTAGQSTCLGACTAAPDLVDPILAIWTDPSNNRYFENTNTEQRILLTLAGKSGGWDYATNFDYSQNHNLFTTTGGELNYNNIAPGGVISDLINPFGPQSAAGAAFLNSQYQTGTLGSGSLSMWSFNGSATHELGDAFNAGRPSQLALGFDVRGERVDFSTTALAVALYTDTYYPPIIPSIVGSRNVQAVYSELNVPVTKSLEFTLSDREDMYSDFGQTNNGKISFRYQPTGSLTFRGAASTGFRAPSLVDLYSPNTFGATAGTMQGPNCSTNPPTYNTEFSQTVCGSQGLGLDGSNPHLKPETSQNFDLGVIFEPISGLGITLDYYRVVIKNEIQAIPDAAIYGNPVTFASQIVLNNAGTFTTAPTANINCQPYTAPTCGYILQTLQNTGGIATSGVDLSADYTVSTDYGKIHVGLDGTVVNRYQLQTYTGGPALDLTGQWNEGFQPVVRWQHLLAVDWTSGIWSAGLSNHFLSSYKDYAYDNGVPYNSTSPQTGVARPTVSSYSTWNIYGSVKPIQSLTVLVGIRNLLDTNPPFSNQEADWQASMNPRLSDPTGRAFYGKVKYEF
jgi:iron complex outermembrane recepter protein